MVIQATNMMGIYSSVCLTGFVDSIDHGLKPAFKSAPPTILWTEVVCHILLSEGCPPIPGGEAKGPQTGIFNLGRRFAQLVCNPNFGPNETFPPTDETSPLERCLRL